jgi:uncharacterized Zn finger protein
MDILFSVSTTEDNMTRNVALEELAARWISKGLVDPKRAMKALQLAKRGAVVANADGSFSVKGSEPTPYRVIKGACTCPDSAARGEHCKHRLAVSLVVKVDARPAPQVEFLSALGVAA